MYFEDRELGETPNTIFDYFPDDMLVIMDESHMSVPQMRSMPSADRSRKYSLIEHGFRLPTAAEHRPLGFDELEYMLGRNKLKTVDIDGNPIIKNLTSAQKSKAKIQEKKAKLAQSKISSDIYIPEHNLTKNKSQARTIFVSATPAEYEMENCDVLAEQIIRPT